MFSVPLPSTAAVHDPDYSFNASGLVLELTCADTADRDRVTRSTIRFARIAAVRWRAEIYCRPWHLKDAYDTVCEILDSDWIGRLKSDCAPELLAGGGLHHYNIYLDSFGSLEVVAGSVTIDNVVLFRGTP